GSQAGFVSLGGGYPGAVGGLIRQALEPSLGIIFRNKTPFSDLATLQATSSYFGVRGCPADTVPATEFIDAEGSQRRSGGGNFRTVHGVTTFYVRDHPGTHAQVSASEGNGDTRNLRH